MSWADLNVAIVGATGAVGETLLSLIEERNLQMRRLDLIASERSAGRTRSFRGQQYRVHDLAHFDFSDVDIAFFSAGTSISQQWARKAAQQGALVIDNTNAFRMDADSPLAVPQVNGDLLGTRPRSGIIANPNCSTIPIVRLIAPLDRHFHVRKLIVSTYQAASGAGLTGMEDLRIDARQTLSGAQEAPHAGRFKVPLAFNVIPSIDSMLDTGFTLEEQKVVQESRKILRRPDLQVSATAVRVPVLNCHSAAVYFECEAPLDRQRMLALLRDAPEVTVYDGQGNTPFPTPRFMGNANHVHVGRIRTVPDMPESGWFWVVSDNLRIGAALNAMQVAEQVVAKGVC
ncbi:aspartate-semialdehyde dehydrogenase [Hyalangium versicolor]|uniref:aspartate-semialdehyde dehydrogenase n=1 Tax=Hyalangium versicolor TaxID=2861190 RepID=UPI001CCCFB31|nr:aspartate-semialdehyde dehydrogenase [Hyalangium versicolor]